ncbi:MAG: PspC domain-containing protein [Bacillota bacterium]
MRELRKSLDRKLFGVAAGFAEYFEMDRTLWRAGWVVGSILLPPLALAYLILAIVLPEAVPGPIPTPAPAPAPPPPRQHRRMTKSRDRWLAGVAGGVAEYLDLDPVLVRVLFLASLFLGGTGLLLYLVLALLMPGPDYSYQHYQAR